MGKNENRKLGDEWAAWKGDFGKDITNADAGKRIFMGILLGLYLFSGCVLCLIWFMMAPRMNMLHHHLAAHVGILLAAVWILAGAWYLLMTLSIAHKKHVVLKLKNTEFCITRLAPVVQRWGIRFGISPDRIGNSFVKVSNALMHITARRVPSEKLMILLPRCLLKKQREQILDLSHKWNIPVFTVPGGEMARNLIIQHRPEAVIGVACERDLMSGICDASTKTQVIGIPNCRPEGPCKNTEINLNELKHAVEAFLEKAPKLRELH